ncbi:MAG: chaperone modulator CbpM [Kiloniellaceae bacterium]
MLATFEEVVAEIEVTSGELSAWIERNWVLPVEQGGRYFFDEADLARARLIAELHRDLEVNEEAMPVVLRLLDQVYSLRRALADLNAAIKTLPEEARAQLRAQLRNVSGTSDSPGS